MQDSYSDLRAQLLRVREQLSAERASSGVDERASYREHDEQESADERYFEPESESRSELQELEAEQHSAEQHSAEQLPEPASQASTALRSNTWQPLLSQLDELLYPNNSLAEPLHAPAAASLFAHEYPSLGISASSAESSSWQAELRELHSKFEHDLAHLDLAPSTEAPIAAPVTASMTQTVREVAPIQHSASAPTGGSISSRSHDDALPLPSSSAEKRKADAFFVSFDSDSEADDSR